jgi:DNA-dependent RNA polymerase auxiliary subunit epsilon
MDTITLYVDPDGTDQIRQTKNSDNISYNLNQLKPLCGDIINEFKESLAEHNAGSFFFEAGRYIGTLTGDLDGHFFNMLFFDIGDNDNLAIGISNKFDSPEIRQMFMTRYREYKLNYEKNFNQVRLKVGMSSEE